MKGIQWTKTIDPQSNYFLFILFFAVIFGPAFGFADVYDHMSNVDVQTYVGLSEFEFNQHPVRRYRIIVPVLAVAVETVLGPLFSRVAPNDFPGDFPKIVSFVFVNSAFMAVYAILLFKVGRSILGKGAYWPVLLSVIGILSCRWTMLLAGSALVDSLFLVSLGLLVLGIIDRRFGLVVLAIYIGPWAKEAFLFFVPLLFFVERRNYKFVLLHLVLSGILVFGYRYALDLYIGSDFTESIQRDASHWKVIPNSLSRMFSFHGLYEIGSILGVWNVFLCIGLFFATVRNKLKGHFSFFWGLLVISVLLQALLSYELARMFYLLTPLLVWVLAICLDFLINRLQLKANQS